ncbi:MAG: hypothetical protein GY856_11510 [bacterium]|nr:hypothetical protein [bacterium]
MDKTRKFYSIPALVGMVILLSVPVAASDNATVSLVPEGVSERVVLTVSGPGDLSFKRTFEAGRTPSFELFNRTGNAYADGLYTWELRAAPAKATRTREQGDHGLGRSARTEALASGHFTIADGGFVDPDLTEEVRTKAVDVPTKDQVILDDLIVDGSLCVGMDCVNGESFGFDTIRMKENNLRIRVVDTSSTSSFPSRDWQITFNDSANGGANKFSIDDIDGGRTPFTIEGNAPSHSLYVDDGGRVGFGTSTPVVDLHLKTGNTPTLRLEQDGSSGFTPQTWDVAGNEANMFIRDATNGSLLPFRIVPGAPSNSIYVDAAGEVGFGTTSPQDILHAQGSSQPGVRIVNTSEDADGWRISITNQDDFRITKVATSMVGLAIAPGTGDVTLTGSLTTGGGGACTATPCDGVFHSDFEVESIEEHAAFMWENSYLRGVGSTPADAPINLTRKTAGILNELEKAHIYIEQLHETIQALEGRLEKLESPGK